MPYTVSDPNLPSNVKKLDDTKKAQWVAIFNSAIKDGKDEGTAFAYANGVAAKALIDEWLNVDYALVKETETTTEKPVVPVPASEPPADTTRSVGIIKTILDGIKSLVTMPAISAPVGTKSLRFVQTKEGRLRWIAVPSNNFQDREIETFTEAAHREFVDWATKTGTYPDLWLWHAGPASKWGETDWLDVCDGFLVASGLVDQGKEHIAHNLAREDCGVSHGFYAAKDRETRTIVKYRTFEWSPLPEWAAANEWTAFASGSEAGVGMSFSPTKKDWLIRVGGLPAESVDAMESGLADLAKNLKARGIGYKDMSAMFASVAEEQDALDNVWGTKEVTGANKTKPSEYADVPTEKFLDAENFKYPADEKHLHAALSYFNHEGQQKSGGYSDAKWAAMGAKLAGFLGDGYKYAGGKVVSSTKAMPAAMKKKMDDAEDAADGSDDEAAEGESAGTKKVKKEIADLNTAVKALTDRFDTFMTKMLPVAAKAMQTDDDRTANYFQAITDTLPKGFRASESEKNLAGAGQKQAAAQFLGNDFLDAIIGSTPSANGDGKAAAS